MGYQSFINKCSQGETMNEGWGGLKFQGSLTVQYSDQMDMAVMEHFGTVTTMHIPLTTHGVTRHHHRRA